MTDTLVAVLLGASAVLRLPVAAMETVETAETAEIAMETDTAEEVAGATSIVLPLLTVTVNLMEAVDETMEELTLETTGDDVHRLLDETDEAQVQFVVEEEADTPARLALVEVETAMAVATTVSRPPRGVVREAI